MDMIYRRLVAIGKGGQGGGGLWVGEGGWEG